MTIEGVLETALYADDLEAAEAFYRDVLGLPLHSRQVGRHVFFRCGEGMLLLFDPAVCSDPRAPHPPHGARGPGHVCLAVAAEEVNAWQRKLDQAGVPIEHITDWPQGGRSLYFRDPAGNSLELAPRQIWQAD